LRILVTGANGFIGKHLVEELRKQESNDVHTFGRENCDISVDHLVAHAMKTHKPDVIYHLAGNPITKLDEQSPNDIVYDNIIGTQNVVHYAPEGCKIVFTSSAVVYGDYGNNPLREDTVCCPTSTYGITKLAAEHLVNVYSRMGRIRGINARLVANVGAGARRGVVLDIIRKLISNSKELELLGDKPGSLKPYTYVGDTVSALILLANGPIDCGTFNVGLENQMTIEQLAYTIMEEINIIKPITWLGESANWQGDNRYICINNSKIKWLGWSPKYKTSYSAICQAVKEIVGK
jgi:nucleoside-diphosphate-sugar epimerase